ncbi:dipeptidase PepV [Secundilactobacillus oryzae JCM 18671]|uniref:Dipeptidase PepV n=1 Tax=Secundilactobacillus oryzae JCM 18671 TaxID=1291743 RepID=A0A081BG79_9LACO|nr:dipeptidase PepV [Secundilactobacillus oryzae]GAK47047.1 dipeptidase PepV [Secundilactobacillus oryzae JCM 18671]
MPINWKQEADAQKAAYLEDLKTLIAIESVRDDSKKTEDMPLGPGPAKALQAFLGLAERDGFKTKNLDNLAGYVEYGEGDETVAILAHADVMPAGNGWDTDPFTLTEKDGNVYGRGTSDDKGPGLAAYYGLKLVKKLGLPLNKKVRFIIGTDEESEWTGMTHYFNSEPAPTMGFSPDAEFALINGEKGNASFTFHSEGTNGNEDRLISFDSGLRENMVPRDAEAVVETSDNEALATAFTKFLDENPVTGDVSVSGEGVALHVIGKAAHGMEPKNGINAGTYLAVFLQKATQLGGSAQQYIDFIADQLHEDSRVAKMGMAFTDATMGDLTMNVGVMKFQANEAGEIVLNFRYPKGMTNDDIEAGLKRFAEAGHFTLTAGRTMVPHYVDPQDPIVQKLMTVYRNQTGETDAEPEVVGGGTYGRLMDRGVAFGALFPHTTDSMHQANEFQPIADLIQAMSIYGESIYELAKDKD